MQNQEQSNQLTFKPNWFAIIAAIVGFLLYANTIMHNYALDDRAAILENEYVTDGISGIPKIMTQDFWHFENAALGYYRPLSLVTFAIENQFFLKNPHVSHLGNVILYALTGFFLCLLLMNIFKNVSPVFSLIITLLFIAHPIHTEVVANIKSRDELLSFLNLIIAIFLFLKAFVIKTNYKLLFLSCIFFYLALLSKETAMTGLLIVPLILFFSFDLSLKKSLIRSIPFLLLLLIFLFQKYRILGTISGYVPDDIVNYPYTGAIGTRIASSLLIFMHYLQLIIFPHLLSYDYSYNQVPAANFNFLTIIGVLIVIALLYVILRGILKKSLPAFGGFLFLITLSPALLFVLTRGGIMAERLLYAPALGFCIVIAWLICFKFRNFQFDRSNHLDFKSYFLPLLSLSVIFSLYSFKTVKRNLAWEDNITLFSTDVTTSPMSCQVHRHYGSELVAQSIVEKDPEKKNELFDKAIHELKTAIDIHPRFGDAVFQIAYAYQFIKQNDDSAIFYYNRAIEYAPGLAEAYNNIGAIYEKLGRPELASYYFNKAVEANPYFSTGKQNRDNYVKKTGMDVHTFPSKLDPEIIEKMAKNKDAAFYFKLGTMIIQKDTTHALEAATYLKKAIEMDPKMEDAYVNLATCYGIAKKYNEGVEALNTLLKINPKNKDAYLLLGVIYGRIGDKEKAKEYNEMAKKLSN